MRSDDNCATVQGEASQLSRATSIRPQRQPLPGLSRALLALFLAACGAHPAPIPAPAPILPGAPQPGVASTEAKPSDHSQPPPPPTDVDLVVGDLGLSAKLSDLLGEPEGPTMAVHFIDVGQGDGTLIRTPGGKSILIDTGSRFARNRLLRYLGDLGVHRIDLLVNTHAHADHIGNVAAVIGEMTVAAILDSGFVHSSPDYEQMLSAIEGDKIPVKIARRGRKIAVEEGLVIEVLAPQEPFVNGSRSDVNSNSVVLAVDFKGMRFLFTGDAEHETEERLLSGNTMGQLRATVLKVAHHGSKYASSDGFLDAVRPRLAVIMCSKRNRYGHPAPATIDRLHAHGAATLQSPVNGNIIVATDGKKLKVVTVPRYGGPFGGAKVWSPQAEAARAAHPPRGPPVSSGSTTKGSTALVDLNTATAAALRALPGVGPKTAQRIVEDRKKRGPFKTVDELRRVKGIGKKKLEKLRPFATVTVPTN